MQRGHVSPTGPLQHFKAGVTERRPCFHTWHPSVPWRQTLAMSWMLIVCTLNTRCYPPGGPPFSSAAPPLGHTPSFLPWTRAGGGVPSDRPPAAPQSCTLLPHSSWSNLVKSEIRSMPPPYWYPPMVPIKLTIKVSLLTWTSKPCDVWAQPPLEADPAHLHWPFSQLWSLQAHSHLPTFTLAIALIFFPSQLRCHLLWVFS